MDQLAQLVGALLILAAFVATQARRLAPQSVVYLVLNLVGSAILAVVALAGDDWGFLLLEVAWALVSAWGLIQVARGRDASTAH